MAAAVPIRARIGLVIPSGNRLTEPQFTDYAPSGVQIHVTRLRIMGAYHRPLPEQLPRIVEAAQMLADAKCDVIVFHCTGSAMADGREAATARSRRGRPPGPEREREPEPEPEIEASALDMRRPPEGASRRRRLQRAYSLVGRRRTGTRARRHQYS